MICVLRIPRTKSEIEANFKRKALLKQFNGKMKQLNTKDLDDMTYKWVSDDNIFMLSFMSLLI